MTRQVRVRGEYAKTADRRRDILMAAVAVFSESGFRSGSLRDVANRVGLSQAGLLHHFPSKHHLLEAVLDWRDADARSGLGDPLPEGVALLRAMVGVVESNVRTPALVDLHVTLSSEATSPDHPVHEYFIRRYETVVGLARRAFDEAAAAGDLLPSVDPASAARNMVALMDGLQVQWLLDSSVDMPADLRAYLRPLLTVDIDASPST